MPSSASRSCGLPGETLVGKRPGGQFGEFLRLGDDLLPGARAFHDPQAQRIVVVGSRR